MTHAKTDVAIVGGGVAGCAIARALAAEYDVTVVERDNLASEATALSAGLITMTPSYSDVPEIPAHANEFFHAFDGTGQFQYTERASLELVPPGNEGEARRRADRLAAEGIDVEFVDGETAVERHPDVDVSDFVGAVRFADTGWVDPYTFAVTLGTDAERRGATMLTETPVSEVLVEDGAVAGVATPDGEIAADTVVAAAGWRTPTPLAGLVDLPVRPYRTQIIVLDPGRSVADLPVGWLPDEHVYFRPEHNGDLLVGGWSFAEDDPVGASEKADEAFRDHVAGVVPEVFRDMDSARFVNGWAGIDGATPDTRPIIDTPDDAPDGLVVATGFHGRGIMTAPVAATAVESLVAGTDAPFPVSTFALDRFDSRDRDFEFHSISA